MPSRTVARTARSLSLYLTDVQRARVPPMPCTTHRKQMPRVILFRRTAMPVSRTPLKSNRTRSAAIAYGNYYARSHSYWLVYSRMRSCAIVYTRMHSLLDKHSLVFSYILVFYCNPFLYSIVILYSGILVFLYSLVYCFFTVSLCV